MLSCAQDRHRSREGCANTHTHMHSCMHALVLPPWIRCFVKRYTFMAHMRAFVHACVIEHVSRSIQAPYEDGTCTRMPMLLLFSCLRRCVLFFQTPLQTHFYPRNRMHNGETAVSFWSSLFRKLFIRRAPKDQGTCLPGRVLQLRACAPSIFATCFF
jgi:hypothetical protein